MAPSEAVTRSAIAFVWARWDEFRFGTFPCCDSLHWMLQISASALTAEGVGHGVGAATLGEEDEANAADGEDDLREALGEGCEVL